MSFIQIYLQGFLVIMAMMTILWIVSIFIKNVSIVDAFWGFGFVLAGIFYFFRTDGFEIRKIIVVFLLVIWGLRLTIYLAWRNWGKGEDFRYKKFRKDYGEHRYWWFSFFQVFLLQGILVWLISAPLLAVHYFSTGTALGILDFVAITVWIIGFMFEAGGDYQMAEFKSNPLNKHRISRSLNPQSHPR